MNSLDDKLNAFKKLLEIMDELREKCPWDRKQTFESLRNLTIEETYELSEAILSQNPEEIRNELGDIMLHIVFYAKIASEKRGFDIADVLNFINKKLKYRHPHVFGEIRVSGSQDVKKNWEELKMKEGKKLLEGVPDSLPAMIKANRIQEKVRAIGFDWDKPGDVWEKVKEETEELSAEIDSMDHDKIESEFGDLFFSLINAARLYGIEADLALEKTNRKFSERFAKLEGRTLAKGHSLKDMSLDEMNKIWEEIKDSDPE